MEAHSISVSGILYTFCNITPCLVLTATYGKQGSISP